jgi:hypothetical protein
MSEFAYHLAGEANSNGHSCRKVSATPLRHEYVYGKIVYCIAPEKRVSVLTEFFDRSGELLKVWTPTRLEQIDGIWTPLDQIMENVQSRAVSQLEIVSIQHHATFPPETFTKAYLDR